MFCRNSVRLSSRRSRAARASSSGRLSPKSSMHSWVLVRLSVEVYWAVVISNSTEFTRRLSAVTWDW